MEIEEMEQCSSDIQQGPLKGLRTVYEHIYTEHHQENPFEYTLTATARELYIKYCKGKTNMSCCLAFGGVAEAVSVHFFFICRTQSDIALFPNS